MTVAPRAHLDALGRALLVATEITTLAMAAHAFAGGRLPDPAQVLSFGAVVLAAVMAHAGRRVSVPVLGAFVFVAQLALHAWSEPAPAHDSMAAMSGMPAMAPMRTSPDMTGPMLWAHAVGALITVLVLLLQERALELVVGRFIATKTPASPTLHGVRPAYERVAVRTVLLAVSPRRGPPVVAAAP